MSAILRHMSFSFWLTSRSIMCARPVHVLTGRYLPFLWLNHSPVCTCTTSCLPIRLSMGIWVVCIAFITVKNAVIHMKVHRSHRNRVKIFKLHDSGKRKKERTSKFPSDVLLTKTHEVWASWMYVNEVCKACSEKAFCLEVITYDPRESLTCSIAAHCSWISASIMALLIATQE